MRTSLVIGGAALGLAAGGIAFEIKGAHAAGTAQKTHATSAALNNGLPVFRFVHPGGHFYTIEPQEAANAGPKFGFHYEGVAFSAFRSDQAPAGTITVIRLIKGNDHFYTIDLNEAKNAQTQLGYKLEGNAFNVYRTPQKGTVAIYRLHSPTEGHFYATGLDQARGAATQYGFTYEPSVPKNHDPIPYFYALPPTKATF